jgi:hypothetical protein
MALLIAAFVWQSPTRLIRAQVLSMRESGYVQMARLSGASTSHIMFREMLPNLVPYLFGSFIANVTTSIVTAVGLEVLGLGPQRIPTLGRVIYDAINSGRADPEPLVVVGHSHGAAGGDVHRAPSDQPGPRRSVEPAPEEAVMSVLEGSARPWGGVVQSNRVRFIDLPTSRNP